MAGPRSLKEAQREEVEWYLKNGAHGRMRIGQDRDGHEYVIGDHSWNRGTRPYEYIELRMNADLRRS